MNITVAFGRLSGVPLQPVSISNVTDLCSCCQQCTVSTFCAAYGIVGGVCTIYDDTEGVCPQPVLYISGTGTDTLYSGGCSLGYPWVPFARNLKYL